MSLEKFETIQQMGRFTLRDEGKTICVGKILKYKPYNKSTEAAVAQVTKQLESTQISSTTVVEPAKELVYNMDTGEMTEKAPDLNAIAEEDD